MAEQLPGKGFPGWLGRQIGYLKRAVRADIGSKTVYREQKVEEANLPQEPNVRLRRTTIDEVIVSRVSNPCPDQSHGLETRDTE